ncbi:LacI family DNA-binding transcriptional regulator [Kitasatospora atroaurantiaca]|uniref:LacI family transcriptional regulator n=1 Tax=Kitasatospora atroaurantiaca TaxID=285545 RepID=A0A561EIR5_9ACTN|nr:LacI family DNA-binding transcriptional regulator [Kitasatospora atroaurantiaca]TWE15516.1 LacI family transcriptional regulator [Kitasatospora atroaurantiaca]
MTGLDESQAVPGRNRPPSQADVAALAGVSAQTVSRVANNRTNVDEETRERVLSAMRMLGYQRNTAARALATGQFHMLGVISFDLSAHGNARTLQAISRAAQSAGYSVNVAGVQTQTEGAVQQAFSQLTSQAVDGIVLIEAQILDRPGLQLPSGVPVVVADGDPDQRFPSVDNNQAAGARAATEHLLSLGHHTVWHLAGPQDSYSARRRAAAWHSTLKEAGAPVPPLLFGDWSAESGYAIGKELAARREVTAVFAANDHMALGLIRALHEAGRGVPDEVSVVGFDDVAESAFFLPPLTTVHQDFEEVGRQCVTLLLDQITTGRNAAGTVTTVPPRLVERASTARPH